MKNKSVILTIFIMASCCSHRTMTSETKVLTSDSAVGLFTANDSIVASRFDSIISSLEITIDYLVINDTTKEKKVAIHARKERLTKKTTEHKVDSSRFLHQENSFKSEEEKQTIIKRNKGRSIPILIMCFIVFIICALIIHKWR